MRDSSNLQFSEEGENKENMNQSQEESQHYNGLILSPKQQLAPQDYQPSLLHFTCKE